jgi:hypothetical protein
MDGLQIPPHSHRLSVRAVAVLSLLAVAGFASGLARQAERAAPALFPARQPAAVQALAAIPEARPAPDMQLAAAPPPPPHHARRAEDRPEPATDSAPTDPAAAAPAAATDASVTAPDPAPGAGATPPPDGTTPPGDNTPT